MMERTDKLRASSLVLICSAGSFPSPAPITQVDKQNTGYDPVTLNGSRGVIVFY